ncbi:MAG: hypothetical protein K6G04_08200 [Lachnospiraceae bacterium]|nr:hypothetical protein [Lachnospiraceae bacterium]
MKRSGNVILGLVLILLAAYLVFDGLGVKVPLFAGIHLSVGSIIILVLCISGIINGIKEHDKGSFFVGLIIGYYILAKACGWPHISLWTAILAAILVSMGIGMIGHKKKRYTFTGSDGMTRTYDRYEDMRDAMARENGSYGQAGVGTDYNEYLDSSVAFSTITNYVESGNFHGGNVEAIFATSNIYLDRVTVAPEDAVLHCNVYFATLKIYVPKEWNVYDRTGHVFSSKTEVNGFVREGQPSLVVDGECIFGKIKIIRL